MSKTNYSPTFPMFPGDAVVIVPSDTVRLLTNAVIYVGGGGNVTVTTAQGTKLAFTGVLGGGVIPVQVIQVWSTGTTATSMVGIY